MSARYLIDLKMRKSKIIHVYRNGDKYSRAALILLKPIEQKELERIFLAVEEKITLPNNKPIKRIFTIDGDDIEQPWQLEDQSYYVVGSTDNFIKTEYGTIRDWSITGPDKWSKYLNFIYESPECQEIATSRSSNDQWNHVNRNGVNQSSKMTKSMSAFHSDRKPSNKDKKITLSIPDVRRSASVPRNDTNTTITQDDVLTRVKKDPLELKDNSPETAPLSGKKLVDNADNRKMEQHVDNEKRFHIEESDRKLDFHSLEKKESLEWTRLDNDNNDAQSRIDEYENSFEHTDPDITSEIRNKFKERDSEINDLSEESTGDLVNNDLDNECAEKAGDDQENDLMFSQASEELDECDSIEIAEKAKCEKEDEENNANFKSSKSGKIDDGNLILNDEKMQLKEQDDSTKQNMDINSLENLEENGSMKYESENKIEDEDEDSFKEKEKAALLIQANFRGNLKNRFGKSKINENKVREEELKVKNKAATIIQSNFRGHVVRDGLKNNSDQINDIDDLKSDGKQDQSYELNEDQSEELKEDEMDEEEMDEEEIDDDNTDQEEKEKAALVIQANFRGHLVREELKLSHKCNIEVKSGNTQNDGNDSEESISEDSNMEEKQNAALVIQANFRGHLIREELKQSHKSNIRPKNGGSDSAEAISEEDDMEEKQKAALLIQANFRGHLVREDIKNSSKHNNTSISDDEDKYSSRFTENQGKENSKGKETPPEITILNPFEQNDGVGSDGEQNNQNYSDKDNKDIEKAAIVIQSNFRGYLTRVGLKSSSSVIGDIEEDEEHDRSYAVHDSDDEDDDLNYPVQISPKNDIIVDQSQLNNKYSDDTFYSSNRS